MKRFWILATAIGAICGRTTSIDASTPVFDIVRSPWFDAPAETTPGIEAAEPVALTASQNEAIPSLVDDADYFDVACEKCNPRLFGLIAQSDRDFSCFVSPQSNVLLFEDPRTLTEVRMHFVNQTIPNSNPVFGGGTAQFVAAQVRVALTQRLSVIATKDGYLWINPEGNAVPNSEGFANIAAGLKYNILRNPDTQTIVSAGFTHEFPAGARRVFQGIGRGEWNLFLTGCREFFGCAHWVSGGGILLPDNDLQSTSMYWSNSFDVQLTKRLYGLVQLNWFHWLESGTNLPLNFEGNDLMNLGSTNVAGNDIVTMSFGNRLKFGRYHEMGVAYELPLTERKDLLESRIYADLILRY